MLDVSSEAIFFFHYEDALKKVRKYGNVVKQLQNLYNKREHFASYIIDTTPGTRFSRSSSPAEINHSSLVSHLGGRKWQGEFDEQLLQCLKRQKKFTNYVQNKISRTFMKNVSYNCQLKKESAAHPSLIEATKKLNLKSLADFQYM